MFLLLIKFLNDIFQIFAIFDTFNNISFDFQANTALVMSNDHVNIICTSYLQQKIRLR
jgi:hypothetical protein